MPTAKKPKTKRVQMSIPVSHEEKERIRLAAALTGQSVNHFVVSSLVERTEEIRAQGEASRMLVDVPAG